MKFNWGTGIFIFIALFLIASISFVIWTLGLDFNLVEKDYYPKGLQYDTVIQKKRNAEALEENITAEISKAYILLRFPSQVKGQQISGNVLIYRPSDERKDLVIPLKTDTACLMQIKRDNLGKGKYILKINWKLGATGYYQEIETYLP